MRGARWSAGPLLLLAAGCRADRSVMETASPAADTLAGIGWLVLVAFSVIAAVMIALTVWAAARRRGSLTEHAPVDVVDGKRWVQVGGLILPAVLFGAMFFVGVYGMAASPMKGAAHHAPDIRITGNQWWWKIEYLGDPPSQGVTTANELHLPVGRATDIELVSADVIHSFWVPDLQGKVDLIPGRRNHIRLRPSEAGVFHGQCAEFCGAHHANMRILVVAEPPASFERWLAAQRLPGAEPVSDAARRGRTLFETRACSACHTVRGTAAQGRVGPDLTHLATRRAIAGNMLPNQHAYLTAWATRAQSFKPGVIMPNLSAFSGRELDDLVAYLRQLR